MTYISTARLPRTPKPRDPYENEIPGCYLYYRNRHNTPAPLAYTIEVTTLQLLSLDGPLEPVYRIYLKDIYRANILKYDWVEDSWSEIKLNQIPDVEKLILTLCTEVENIKESIL